MSPQDKQPVGVMTPVLVVTVSVNSKRPPCINWRCPKLLGPGSVSRLPADRIMYIIIYYAFCLCGTSQLMCVYRCFFKMELFSFSLPHAYTHTHTHARTHARTQARARNHTHKQILIYALTNSLTNPIRCTQHILIRCVCMFAYMKEYMPDAMQITSSSSALIVPCNHVMTHLKNCLYYSCFVLLSRLFHVVCPLNCVC